MADIVPQGLQKKLRACMLCSLVKTQVSFQQDGCENCEQVLNYKGDPERVMECTSASFEGVMAVMRPEASWTARWQRIDKFAKGIYAVQVIGKLPIEVQEQLLDKGIKYRARDGTIGVVRESIEKVRQPQFLPYKNSMLKLPILVPKQSPLPETLLANEESLQEQKRKERLIKNRLAADASRKRKREQFEALSDRCNSLESENIMLKQRIEELETLLQTKECENMILSQKLMNWSQVDPAMPMLSMPSPQASSDSDESLKDDFSLDDYVDFNNVPIPTVFTILLFSFAAFLFPSFDTNETVTSLSTFDPIGSSLSPVPQVYPKDLFSPSLASFPKVSHEVQSSSQSIQSSICLEKPQFMSSLHALSQINHPNAISSIQSLFLDQNGMLEADAALIPSFQQSSSQGFKSTREDKASVFFQPNIRLAPFVPIPGQKMPSPPDSMALSLFAKVPPPPSTSSPGGVLRLDMQVFEATWLA